MKPEIVQFLNQPWLYLATAALVALMGLYSLKTPHRPGTRAFGWMVTLWMIWALTAAVDSVVRSLEQRYVLWVLQSILSLLVPGLGLLFFIDYTGNEKWLTRFRPGLLALAFPPFLFALLAVFLPRSALISNSYYADPRLIIANDVVRWGFFAFILIILCINLWILTASLLNTHAFNSAILFIIVGEIIPHVVFVFNDPGVSNISPIKLALLASTFTALALFIALFFYGLLQVIPVARDTVINIMPYSVIVLDAQNHLVDFNTAAQALPGMPKKLYLGKTASQVLGDWWTRIAPLVGPDPDSRDIVLNNDAGEQHFHIKSSPLRQMSGWRMGQVIVVEDNTPAWQAQRQQAQTLWSQATLQERQQLALELHDGLSQNLAFLSMQTQAALIQAKSGQHQAAQANLTRLAEVASLIEEDTRELIGNLISVNMPSDNFIQTLRNTISDFEQQSGLAVHFDVDGDPTVDRNEFFNSTKLPPPVAIQLIRMAQEALANVRKHACNASHVNVGLNDLKDQMLLVISDDGAGFDPSAVKTNGKHFGLRILRQRAGRIGGHVVINSAPGRGTRVEIYAPYEITESGGWG